MKSNYARALPKAWTGMSKIFTALGDERRQRILLLFARGEKLNAGQIAAACPLVCVSAISILLDPQLDQSVVPLTALIGVPGAAVSTQNHPKQHSSQKPTPAQTLPDPPLHDWTGL